MAHEYAVRLGLIAFATAALQGLAGGAAFQPALKTALLALAAFYVLGLVCGELARRVVEESVLAEAKKSLEASAGTETTTRAAAAK